MKDVLSCGQCGSRRLSGTPDQGFFCHDCGLHARVDFETEESFGNAREHQEDFWSSYDSRFDDPPAPWQGGPLPGEAEANSTQQTADSSGERSAEARKEGSSGSGSEPAASEQRNQRATARGTSSEAAEPAPSEERNQPLFSDPHSHLRCACCFELAARCRRLGAGAGLRCCVGCRCSAES